MEAGPHSVPKEPILPAHVFSFDRLSPLPSLAWCAAWKGGGTVETGQRAKEIKLLLKDRPDDIKISVFFRRSPSTGEIAPLYLSVLVSFIVKPASPLCFTLELRSVGIANIC